MNNRKIIADLSSLKNSINNLEVKSAQKSENFNIKNYTAGIVYPGEKLQFGFTQTSDKKVSTIKASCGCTTTKKITNKKLEGNINVATNWAANKARFIPQAKSITVNFEDKGSEVLYVNYIVDKFGKI